MKDSIGTDLPERSFVLTAIYGVTGLTAAIFTFFTNGVFFLFCFATSIFCIIVTSYQLRRSQRTVSGGQVNKLSLKSVLPESIDKVPFFNNLSIRKIDVSVIGEDRNLLVAGGAIGQKIKAYAIEFSLDPECGVKGSVNLEAYLKVGNNPVRRGSWLKSSRNEASISINESDFLILAVKQMDNLINSEVLHQYEKQPRYFENERLICGEFYPIIDNCVFQIEYFCLQERSIIKKGVIEFDLPRP